MSKRVLGKGLSALIPDKESTSVDENIVAYVDIELIKDNSLQPRSDYDDAKLEELKASIKEKGVLQPILVRKQADGYEVIAGERRLRAARAINLAKVPVIIKEVSDNEALILALVENIQREDLNPIEEAEAYKRLMEEFNFTYNEIARSVGKGTTTIINMLRLLKLPSRIREALVKGEITTGHARALLGSDNPEEQINLFEMVTKKKLSVREVERMVKVGRQTNRKGQQGHKQNTIAHELIALEEELQKLLGTKVRLSFRKSRGKLVVEYYSMDELDRIVRIIKKGISSE